jgi:hypothetical protein
LKGGNDIASQIGHFNFIRAIQAIITELKRQDLPHLLKEPFPRSLPHERVHHHDAADDGAIPAK